MYRRKGIATTQLYALMNTSTLRKRFDVVTAQPVRDLLYQMERLHEN